MCCFSNSERNGLVETIEHVEKTFMCFIFNMDSGYLLEEHKLHAGECLNEKVAPVYSDTFHNICSYPNSLNV